MSRLVRRPDPNAPAQQVSQHRIALTSTHLLKWFVDDDPLDVILIKVTTPYSRIKLMEMEMVMEEGMIKEVVLPVEAPAVVVLEEEVILVVMEEVAVQEALAVVMAAVAAVTTRPCRPRSQIFSSSNQTTCVFARALLLFFCMPTISFNTLHARCSLSAFLLIQNTKYFYFISFCLSFPVPSTGPTVLPPRAPKQPRPTWTDSAPSPRSSRGLTLLA